MENVALLRQALPYIRKYKNKIFVVKLGGELAGSTDVLDDLSQDLSLFHQIGIKLLVVHGGGPQANELSEKLGITPKFFEGRRITDEAALEVTKMVFAGKINHEILTMLRKHGAKSVGLSGIDGDVVIAKRRAPVEVVDRETGRRNTLDYGHVGDVTEVNVELLKILLENGYIPVISSLADDGEGHILNINADTVAARIAVSIGADKYITMTNVGGILRDVNDPKSRISVASKTETLRFIEDRIITGGMIPKIRECIRALDMGVRRVHILNGLEKNSLLLEVFTKKGNGTMIVSDLEYEEYLRSG